MAHEPVPAVELEVRRLGAGEAELLRTARLRALADAPDAFVETLDEARATPAATWVERAALAGAARDEVVVLGLHTGEPVGMAGGRWRDETREVAGIWGMWVDPSTRRTGLGGALVDGVRDWAAAHGARRLRLGVMCDQPGSIAFYARLGFAPEGTEQTFIRDPSRRWQAMTRPL